MISNFFLTSLLETEYGAEDPLISSSMMFLRVFIICMHSPDPGFTMLLCIYAYIYYILQKNPKEVFGQPNSYLSIYYLSIPLSKIKFIIFFLITVN